VAVKSSDPRWIMVALRKGLTWKGRARRAEVWWYMTVVVATGLSLLLSIAVTDPDAEPGIWQSLPGWLFMIAYVPGVSCAIRRLHDLDRSGWWYLLLFASVPVAMLPVLAIFDSLDNIASSIAIWLALASGALCLSYWFVQRGTIGDNRYGPDPLMVD
jgi:uncharacterized membrane protein YhaH (DUF805 family)